MRVGFLSGEDPLEEGRATHSSILACRIPRTQEPGGLPYAKSPTPLKRLSTHAQIIQNDLKSVHGIAFTRTLFPYKITITGSWNQNVDIFEGHYSTHYTSIFNPLIFFSIAGNRGFYFVSCLRYKTRNEKLRKHFNILGKQSSIECRCKQVSL